MQSSFKINILDVQKKPIGISIPLTENSTTFFSQTFTTLDQYKTNIINLIMTAKGERRMFPTYGSNLKKRIFEQGVNLEETLKNDIVSAISEWMPEVTIVSIEVYQDGSNEHAFLIKVFFTVPYSEELQNVEVEVK
ncbi:GPW/gp25 family protein [Candidatus Gracilibacteria bacterium]|jgi:phage baseplate assembly protein W|nr:GPW/gp25 family protein [Candidatus Gracilibacteria bacterium]